MDYRKFDAVPPVKLLMTPFPHAISPEAPLTEARERMKALGIRHLPVRDGAELVGVLSDRDIARRSAELETLSVKDVAEFEPYVVDKDTPVDAVLRVMAERHLGSALVVMSEKLVGIFTTSDACHHFGAMLTALYGPDDDRAA